MNNESLEIDSPRLVHGGGVELIARASCVYGTAHGYQFLTYKFCGRGIDWAAWQATWPSLAE